MFNIKILKSKQNVLHTRRMKIHFIVTQNKKTKKKCNNRQQQQEKEEVEEKKFIALQDFYFKKFPKSDWD